MSHTLSLFKSFKGIGVKLDNAAGMADGGNPIFPADTAAVGGGGIRITECGGSCEAGMGVVGSLGSGDEAA